MRTRHLKISADTFTSSSVCHDCLIYLAIFRNLRDEGKIEPCLQQDAFLYVDTAAIQSSLDHCPLPERDYVLAADASHDATKLPTYLHDLRGPVRVAPT